jgi:Mg2+-importing ATPase
VDPELVARPRRWDMRFIGRYMIEFGALVIRTRRPFYDSRPGTLLLASTGVLIAVALATPYVPIARAFGFVPLPATLLGTLIVITLFYVAATEQQKRWFYRRGAA